MFVFAVRDLRKGNISINPRPPLLVGVAIVQLSQLIFKGIEGRVLFTR
jgi:hypothetical protein